jgi:hypothetical protein
VVVLIISSGGGGTSRAFAVEPHAGGGVAIKIYGLEGAAELEEALERAGIPAQVDWLKAQTTCAERKLTPSTVRTSMGGKARGIEISGPTPALTIGVMTTAQYRAISRADRGRALAGDRQGDSIPNISFDPRSFRPGQSVVIVGSPEPHGGDPEGGYRASVEVVEGPVPACVPVPEAAGSIGAIAGTGDKASAAAAAAALPKPGQFLFTKTEVVQLQAWEQGGRGTGTKAHPRHFTTKLVNPESNALPAFVPTTKEVWTAADGETRVRETLGQIEFLSPADQRRWERRAHRHRSKTTLPNTTSNATAPAARTRNSPPATGAATTSSPRSPSSSACRPKPRRSAWRSKAGPRGARRRPAPATAAPRSSACSKSSPNQSPARRAAPRPSTRSPKSQASATKRTPPAATAKR